MNTRFLKLSLASPESIKYWSERALPNGTKVGKILKGDLIDYKNGLPIRDGLSCERIFGPIVSFSCKCGRFKSIDNSGVHLLYYYNNIINKTPKHVPMSDEEEFELLKKNKIKTNLFSNSTKFFPLISSSSTKTANSLAEFPYRSEMSEEKNTEENENNNSQSTRLNCQAGLGESGESEESGESGESGESEESGESGESDSRFSNTEKSSTSTNKNFSSQGSYYHDLSNVPGFENYSPDKIRFVPPSTKKPRKKLSDLQQSVSDNWKKGESFTNANSFFQKPEDLKIDPFALRKLPFFVKSDPSSNPEPSDKSDQKLNQEERLTETSSPNDLAKEENPNDLAKKENPNDLAKEENSNDLAKEENLNDLAKENPIDFNSKKIKNSSVCSLNFLQNNKKSPKQDMREDDSDIEQDHQLKDWKNGKEKRLVQNKQFFIVLQNKLSKTFLKKWKKNFSKSKLLPDFYWLRKTQNMKKLYFFFPKTFVQNDIISSDVESFPSFFNHPLFQGLWFTPHQPIICRQGVTGRQSDNLKKPNERDIKSSVPVWFCPSMVGYKSHFFEMGKFNITQEKKNKIYEKHVFRLVLSSRYSFVSLKKSSLPSALKPSQKEPIENNQKTLLLRNKGKEIIRLGKAKAFSPMSFIHTDERRAVGNTKKQIYIKSTKYFIWKTTQKFFCLAPFNYKKNMPKFQPNLRGKALKKSYNLLRNFYSLHFFYSPILPFSSKDGVCKGNTTNSSFSPVVFKVPTQKMHALYPKILEQNQARTEVLLYRPVGFFNPLSLCLPVTPCQPIIGWQGVTGRQSDNGLKKENPEKTTTPLAKEKNPELFKKTVSYLVEPEISKLFFPLKLLQHNGSIIGRNNLVETSIFFLEKCFSVFNRSSRISSQLCFSQRTKTKNNRKIKTISLKFLGNIPTKFRNQFKLNRKIGLQTNSFSSIGQRYSAKTLNEKIDRRMFIKKPYHKNNFISSTLNLKEFLGLIKLKLDFSPASIIYRICSRISPSLYSSVRLSFNQKENPRWKNWKNSSLFAYKFANKPFGEPSVSVDKNRNHTILSDFIIYKNYFPHYFIASFKKIVFFSPENSLLKTISKKELEKSNTKKLELPKKTIKRRYLDPDDFPIKFRHFPPKEISYCSNCEVELLPNSIRRYRMGYIEFVSPVAHIWYTSRSIPWLLNLSKTLIEGIAECHQGLSSGFPPISEIWCFDGYGDSTSWNYQHQLLKLPINFVSTNLFLGDQKNYGLASLFWFYTKNKWWFIDGGEWNANRTGEHRKSLGGTLDTEDYQKNKGWLDRPQPKTYFQPSETKINGDFSVRSSWLEAFSTLQEKINELPQRKLNQDVFVPTSRRLFKQVHKIKRDMIQQIISYYLEKKKILFSSLQEDINSNYRSEHSIETKLELQQFNSKRPTQNFLDTLPKALFTYKKKEKIITLNPQKPYPSKQFYFSNFKVEPLFTLLLLRWMRKRYPQSQLFSPFWYKISSLWQQKLFTATENKMQNIKAFIPYITKKQNNDMVTNKLRFISPLTQSRFKMVFIQNLNSFISRKNFLFRLCSDNFEKLNNKKNLKEEYLQNYHWLVQDSWKTYYKKTKVTPYGVESFPLLSNLKNPNQRYRKTPIVLSPTIGESLSYPSESKHTGRKYQTPFSAAEYPARENNIWASQGKPLQEIDKFNTMVENKGKLIINHNLFYYFYYFQLEQMINYGTGIFETLFYRNKFQIYMLPFNLNQKKFLVEFKPIIFLEAKKTLDELEDSLKNKTKTIKHLSIFYCFSIFSPTFFLNNPFSFNFLKKKENNFKKQTFFFQDFPNRLNSHVSKGNTIFREKNKGYDFEQKISEGSCFQKKHHSLSSSSVGFFNTLAYNSWFLIPVCLERLPKGVKKNSSVSMKDIRENTFGSVIRKTFSPIKNFPFTLTFSTIEKSYLSKKPEKYFFPKESLKSTFSKKKNFRSIFKKWTAPKKKIRLPVKLEKILPIEFLGFFKSFIKRNFLNNAFISFSSFKSFYTLFSSIVLLPIYRASKKKSIHESKKKEKNSLAPWEKSTFGFLKPYFSSSFPDLLKKGSPYVHYFSDLLEISRKKGSPCVWKTIWPKTCLQASREEFPDSMQKFQVINTDKSLFYLNKQEIPNQNSRLSIPSLLHRVHSGHVENKASKFNRKSEKKHTETAFSDNSKKNYKNKNYYGCISQITNWGSDNESWIFFVKYFRPFLYQGDFLLPYAEKRTNFQLMPRTGGMILEYLLSAIEICFAKEKNSSNFSTYLESKKPKIVSPWLQFLFTPRWLCTTPLKVFPWTMKKTPGKTVGLYTSTETNLRKINQMIPTKFLYQNHKKLKFNQTTSVVSLISFSVPFKRKTKEKIVENHLAKRWAVTQLGNQHQQLAFNFNTRQKKYSNKQEEVYKQALGRFPLFLKRTFHRPLVGKKVPKGGYPMGIKRTDSLETNHASYAVKKILRFQKKVFETTDRVSSIKFEKPFNWYQLNQFFSYPDVRVSKFIYSLIISCKRKTFATSWKTIGNPMQSLFFSCQTNPFSILANKFVKKRNTRIKKRTPWKNDLSNLSNRHSSLPPFRLLDQREKLKNKEVLVRHSFSTVFWPKKSLKSAYKLKTIKTSSVPSSTKKKLISSRDSYSQENQTGTQQPVFEKSKISTIYYQISSFYYHFTSRFNFLILTREEKPFLSSFFFSKKKDKVKKDFAQTYQKRSKFFFRVYRPNKHPARPTASKTKQLDFLRKFSTMVMHITIYPYKLWLEMKNKRKKQPRFYVFPPKIANFFGESQTETICKQIPQHEKKFNISNQKLWHIGNFYGLHQPSNGQKKHFYRPEKFHFYFSNGIYRLVSESSQKFCGASFSQQSFQKPEKRKEENNQAQAIQWNLNKKKKIYNILISDFFTIDWQNNTNENLSFLPQLQQEKILVSSFFNPVVPLASKWNTGSQKQNGFFNPVVPLASKWNTGSQKRNGSKWNYDHKFKSLYSHYSMLNYDQKLIRKTGENKYTNFLQGETLLIKFKELGNYSKQLKKKNTALKTLILKMDSLLQPLNISENYYQKVCFYSQLNPDLSFRFSMLKSLLVSQINKNLQVTFRKQILEPFQNKRTQSQFNFNSYEWLITKQKNFQKWKTFTKKTLPLDLNQEKYKTYKNRWSAFYFFHKCLIFCYQNIKPKKYTNELLVTPKNVSGEVNILLGSSEGTFYPVLPFSNNAHLNRNFFLTRSLYLRRVTNVSDASRRKSLVFSNFTKRAGAMKNLGTETRLLVGKRSLLVNWQGGKCFPTQKTVHLLKFLSIWSFINIKLSKNHKLSLFSIGTTFFFSDSIEKNSLPITHSIFQAMPLKGMFQNSKSMKKNYQQSSRFAFGLGSALIFPFRLKNKAIENSLAFEFSACAATPKEMPKKCEQSQRGVFNLIPPVYGEKKEEKTVPFLRPNTPLCFHLHASRNTPRYSGQKTFQYLKTISPKKIFQFYQYRKNFLHKKVLKQFLQVLLKGTPSFSEKSEQLIPAFDFYRPFFLHISLIKNFFSYAFINTKKKKKKKKIGWLDTRLQSLQPTNFAPRQVIKLDRKLEPYYHYRKPPKMKRKRKTRFPFGPLEKIENRRIKRLTKRLSKKFKKFIELKISLYQSDLHHQRYLRRVRLQYLRTFRQLHFFEYFKTTYIKPEWMILSLLPVLPPDLRPIISTATGYITNDMNTHYQNIIYRNNNLDRSLDFQWVYKTMYEIKNKISKIPIHHSFLSFDKFSPSLSFIKSGPRVFEQNSKKSNQFDNEQTLFSITSSEVLIGYSDILSFPNSVRGEKDINRLFPLLVSSRRKTPTKLPEILPMDLIKFAKKKKIFFYSYPMAMANNLKQWMEFSNPRTYWENENPEEKNSKFSQLRWCSPQKENIISSKIFPPYQLMEFHPINFMDGEEKRVDPINEIHRGNLPLHGRPFFNSFLQQAMKSDSVKTLDGFSFFNTHPDLKFRTLRWGCSGFSPWSKKRNSPKWNYDQKSSLFSVPWQIFSFFSTMAENHSTFDKKRSFAGTHPLGINRPNGGIKNSSEVFSLSTKQNNFFKKTYGHYSKTLPWFYPTTGESVSYRSDNQKVSREKLPPKMGNFNIMGENKKIRWQNHQKFSRSIISQEVFAYDYTFTVPTQLHQNYFPIFRQLRQQNLHGSKALQEMQYSLQKAVDALIDNGPKLQSNILLSKGRPLKSLSENLKGKEGRFRQHLLGKRVDYSGRSVIVVGPDLKLYECGIPFMMALKLFQPFLILYLIHGFKIPSVLATKLIQKKHSLVIRILKNFLETWPVLLNRAPTLHRMNIQAFKIRLVQGKAILLHPLVCSSFNADFDGDQMGLHIPITQQARAEAWKLLWSVNNSINLASRQPLFLPSQDMVIGNYYLTRDPLPLFLLSDHVEFQENLNKPQIHRGHGGFLPNQTFLNSESSFNSHLLIFKEKLPIFNNIEEAYKYYLNAISRFHINTPVWFNSISLFETSEREKPIEFFIDQQGYTIFISKYYEIHLKKNRFQGQFLKNHIDDVKSFPVRWDLKKSNGHYRKNRSHTLIETNPVVLEKPFLKKRKENSLLNTHNKVMLYNLKKNYQEKQWGETQIFYLEPISTKQIIRSTFGRIEFYLNTSSYFEK